MNGSVESGVDGVVAVALEAGQSVLAAAESLVDHEGGARVERAREGALRSVASAASERGRTPVRVIAENATTVRFAPSFHGEIVACDVSDGAVATTRGAFLAASDDLQIGADRVGDAPERGDGCFLTTVSGDGALYLAGRGRVEAVTVEGGDEHVVSMPHLVAFEERADVSVGRPGPLEDATPTCRVRGPATAWVATRRARGGHRR